MHALRPCVERVLLQELTYSATERTCTGTFSLIHPLQRVGINRDYKIDQDE